MKYNQLSWVSDFDSFTVNLSLLKLGLQILRFINTYNAESYILSAEILD